MNNKLIKILNLSILLLTAPAAWAETTNCTAITTLPYTITVQGIYCFTGNLATSMVTGNAIEIQTNNVIIDLNGWKLGGLAAGTGTHTYGIYAWQRKNITIRNGTIRGFFYGIWLDDIVPYTTSQGHLVEDIRADMNIYSGIYVGGRGSIVRRNQVVDTGGSTAFSNPNAYGILLLGPGVRVLNNDISGTAATGSGLGYGLYVDTANGAVVEGNRINDVSSGTGNTYGMHIAESNNVLVRGNSITSAAYGIYYSAGGTGSTGKYMDNLTGNIATLAYSGGTAAGTTNY